MKNTKVDGHLKESLSVVMDGEASELELQRVLNHLGSAELRQCAKNYQLAGDVLRKENNLFMNMDISEKVAGRINEESARPREKRRFQLIHSGMGRVAVAASVTIAVIAGVRVWNSGTGQIPAQLAQNGAVGSDSMLSAPAMPEHTQDYGARGLLAGFHTEQSSLTPGQMSEARSIAGMQTLARFKTYSLNHAEMLASRNMHGMLSLVRAAGFQSK